MLGQGVFKESEDLGQRVLEESEELGQDVLKESEESGLLGVSKGIHGVRAASLKESEELEQ